MTTDKPLWPIVVALVAVFLICCGAGFILWRLQLSACWMGC